MPTHQELVQQFYRAVDAGDTSVVKQLFHPEWENIDPSLPPLRGHEGAKALIEMFTTSFPDFRSQIVLMAAEGERVAVHAHHSGTHQGTFLGVPPTGRQVSTTATGIFTCRDGQIVQNRVIFDAFGLLQQLGVIPT
ncbi:MAG: hypothetical protein Fur005_46670 [Roseiflexaceae bacterium]